MEKTGFTDVRIVEETRDFLVTPAMLARPDQLFRFSPLWPLLGQAQRDQALAVMRAPSGDLAVPSTASITTALRP